MHIRNSMFTARRSHHCLPRPANTHTYRQPGSTKLSAYALGEQSWTSSMCWVKNHDHASVHIWLHYNCYHYYYKRAIYLLHMCVYSPCEITAWSLTWRPRFLLHPAWSIGSLSPTNTVCTYTNTLTVEHNAWKSGWLRFPRCSIKDWKKVTFCGWVY